jgi:hypothetical protein
MSPTGPNQRIIIAISDEDAARLHPMTGRKLTIDELAIGGAPLTATPHGWTLTAVVHTENNQWYAQLDRHNLRQLLGEAIGAASMCWEHVDRAGTFDSTRAATVLDALITEIKTVWPDAPLPAS